MLGDHPSKTGSNSKSVSSAPGGIFPTERISKVSMCSNSLIGSCHRSPLASLLVTTCLWFPYLSPPAFGLPVQIHLLRHHLPLVSLQRSRIVEVCAGVLVQVCELQQNARVAGLGGKRHGFPEPTSGGHRCTNAYK